MSPRGATGPAIEASELYQPDIWLRYIAGMSFVQRALAVLLCLLMSGQGTALARHLDNGARQHRHHSEQPLITTPAAQPAHDLHSLQTPEQGCAKKGFCLASAQVAMRSEPKLMKPALTHARIESAAHPVTSRAVPPPEHRPRSQT